MTLAPRLLPRLLPRDAATRFDEVSLEVYGADRDVRAAIERVATEVRADDAGMVYTAVGPGRITESELWAFRERIIEAAILRGYPEPFPAVDAGRAFDDAVTSVLLNETGLFPAEAAVYEVWSYLALILLPDVTAWRAPPDARNRSKHEKGVNAERYVGADLTRHTWSRLWWRGYLITNGVGARRLRGGRWRRGGRSPGTGYGARGSSAAARGRAPYSLRLPEGSFATERLPPSTGNGQQTADRSLDPTPEQQSSAVEPARAYDRSQR